jgi:hypothetical protein
MKLEHFAVVIFFLLGFAALAYLALKISVAEKCASSVSASFARRAFGLG